jgi:hypothetical protein
MEDIRLFMKKNAANIYKLSIAYRDTCTLYKYKFDDFTLLFKETENGIEFHYQKKDYSNFNEIQLLLFDLFDYKNIEYIDVFLQLKIERSKIPIRIEDIYNDYYDDMNKELICVRNLIINEEKIIKFKIVVYDEHEYKLYYNSETISGFNEILEKINKLL